MRRLDSILAILAVLVLPASTSAEIFYRDTIHGATGGSIARPKKIDSVLLIDRTIDSGALCSYIALDASTNARVKLKITVDREDGTRFKHSDRVRLEEGVFQACPMFAQTFEPGDRVTFEWKLKSLPKTLAGGQFLHTTSSVAALEPEFFEAQARELMDMAMESAAKRRLVVAEAGEATLRTHFSHASFYHADEADNFPDAMFNSLVIQDSLEGSELCARFMTYRDVPAGRVRARFELFRGGERIAKAKGGGALQRREGNGDNIPLTGSLRVCPAFADLEPGDVILGRLDLTRLEPKKEDVWFSGDVSASNGLSVF